ncbi:hypothetical protein [Xanthomonas arboricola]|uniref:hypothetical protein n=1 Tax=Xanthomonas arboricola TaxID=56448 RepID=UPI0011B0B742|nr:hypothetical protein [Xanthomonas arboricola]
MESLKKDTILIAVATPLTFLGVYAYESGRYRYLKVPSDLIDLPVNRLLMGGAAIAFLFTMLIAAMAWIRQKLIGQSRFSAFFSYFSVAFLLFGLPSLFYSTTLPEVGLSLIVSLAFAYSGYIEKDKPDPAGESGENKEGAQPIKNSGWYIHTPDMLFSGFLLLLSCWTVSGFGYLNERMTGRRSCAQKMIVAGTIGDNLILKSFSEKTGIISKSVKLHPMENAEIYECSPVLIGGKGYGWGSGPDGHGSTSLQPSDTNRAK